MKIYLASDHAGFELKEEIKNYLSEKGYNLEDTGTYSNEPVSWPEYGAKAAAKVSANPLNSRGIVVCGAGIGMSMVCNKFKNVRAALCHDEFAAEMSRAHNDANILCLAGRIIAKERAFRIVDTWLNTAFEGGRHRDRLDYLHSEVETKNFK